MQSLKSAVEDEDLGRVKSLLNSNPELATEIYYQPDGEPYTILKRAEEVASWYSSPESFAHKIVAELKRRGAQLPAEAPTAHQQVAYNEPNVAPPAPRRPGLPPRHPKTQPKVNISQGIAARPKSSRKRRGGRRKNTRRRKN